MSHEIFSHTYVCLSYFAITCMCNDNNWDISPCGIVSSVDGPISIDYTFVCLENFSCITFETFTHNDSICIYIFIYIFIYMQLQNLNQTNTYNTFDKTICSVEQFSCPCLRDSMWGDVCFVPKNPDCIQKVCIIVTLYWARWRPKSPASRLFTQPFIQAQIEENIKAPRHWPLCGKFTNGRWILCTNGH